MPRYALIGKNIQDSLSPVIHGAYGCQYDLLDVEEDQLEWALNQPYDGFNVTSPYKEKICEYLGTFPGRGVVNVVKNYAGWNTDITGFHKALEMAGVHKHCKIGIIGSGAMSRMLQGVLSNYVLINGRKLHSNGFNSFAGLAGLVNCTPHQEYNLEGLSRAAWVMDLGYKDDTFIKNARGRGHFAFNGMGMLIAQAEESQRIWKNA